MAARRTVVHELRGHGLSERPALRLVGMGANCRRYQAVSDRNDRLRQRLNELAAQLPRHGYRMLHNRLVGGGWFINVKRTYRTASTGRRREKLPVPERQPLLRPLQPNEVWSMDFPFDELAHGRRIKTLTVVDDCSKEAVSIVVDTSIPALYVTRVLDQAAAERGLPKVIRTDNTTRWRLLAGASAAQSSTTIQPPESRSECYGKWGQRSTSANNPTLKPTKQKRGQRPLLCCTSKFRVRSRLECRHRPGPSAQGSVR